MKLQPNLKKVIFPQMLVIFHYAVKHALLQYIRAKKSRWLKPPATHEKNEKKFMYNILYASGDCALIFVQQK
jgi:hypothetical protein